MTLLATTATRAFGGDAAVVLQFDDGTAGHYTHVFPILAEYNLPGSFGIVTGRIGAVGRMNAEQVIEIYEAGHDIQDHTMFHDPAFWGNPENAPYWSARIDWSLRFLRDLGITTRGWNQPGGTGQGFPRELRRQLKKHYSYAAGRVGLDWLREKNFHRRLLDDPLSLGRGGIYSWGYNVPAAALEASGYRVGDEYDVDLLREGIPEPVSAATDSIAELTEIITRLSDGYAQGLVVIPLFHRVRQGDGTAWALEEICRFVTDHGLTVLKMADAIDFVTSTTNDNGDQMTNPAFVDRNGDGRVDGWNNVGMPDSSGALTIQNYSATMVYGPQPGNSRIRFEIRSFVDNEIRLNLRVTELDPGYTYHEHILPFGIPVTNTWTAQTIDFLVTPTTDRVMVDFALVDGPVEIRNVSWKLTNESERSLDTRQQKVELLQNSPNPFNPSTGLTISIDRTQAVSLRVYDVRGRLITTLIDGVLDGGTHSIVWNGRDSHGQPAHSGIYFARLKNESGSRTIKMTLVK